MTEGWGGMVVLTPSGLTFTGFSLGVGGSEGGIQAGPLSLDLSAMAGSHASGGGTGLTRVIVLISSWSFPAPCVSAVTSCPQRKTQTPLNVQNLSNRSPPGFRDISIPLPECPLRWPLHRPIQVLTRGPRPRLHTSVPPRGHGLPSPPCRHAGCYGAIF